MILRFAEILKNQTLARIVEEKIGLLGDVGGITLFLTKNVRELSFGNGKNLDLESGI